MRAAWDLIEQRHLTISAYGCAAHGVNLVIKDIVSLPENSKTSKEASKLIAYINNHHLVHALFDDKRKEAGITRNLSTTVSTRWYSQYTSLKSLNDAKVAVKRLAHEHELELSKIAPKPNSAAVLGLIKSEEFWKRLENFIIILEFPTNVIGKF
jgi:electron transfer flavoprotein alpha subunit